MTQISTSSLGVRFGATTLFTDVTFTIAKGERWGVLGSKVQVFERDFFTGRLAARHGIETLLPESDEREILHRTIFEEFAHGTYTEDTRRWYVELIGRLVDRGAEGIVLGCTEISLLLGPGDVPGVRLLDTTTLHALAAVEFGLGEG